MQKFDTQVACHINDMLYNAVMKIAEKNPVYKWDVAEYVGENMFEKRETWLEKLGDFISSFNKPVLVTNITISVLVDMFFKKKEDYEYKNDSYYVTNSDKKFEIYVDMMLSGGHNQFVVFDEDNIENARIVEFNPDLIV